MSYFILKINILTNKNFIRLSFNKKAFNNNKDDIE